MGDRAMETVGGMQVSKDKTELKNSVIQKAEEIAEVLSKGKHIEIHQSRDGIKFFTVDKKIVK